MIEMTRSAIGVRASPVRVGHTVRRGHHHLVTGTRLRRRSRARSKTVHAQHTGQHSQHQQHEQPPGGTAA